MRRGWIGPAAALAVAVGAALLFQTIPPPRDLDWEGTVVPLALAFMRTAYPSLSSSSTSAGAPASAQPAPLQGLRVVVTGATNGIGLSLTRALTQLGATVIAVGRSAPRLKDLVAELGLDKVIPIQADLEDLQSVARAAEELVRSVDRVDILVNNAGIVDKVSIDTILGWKNFSTPQGFDRVFAVNYLSHVLWTEKLLTVLRHSERPAVVHITSSYHWAVDGTDLIADESGRLPPVAARPGGSRGFFLYRTQRSYANSKLAQIYHSRSLQQRHPDLVVRSVCPAWVATQIAGSPGTLAHRVMRTVGYPVDGWGLASTLQAILSLEQGSDYYSNTDFFNFFHRPFGQLPSWTYTYGFRDVMAHLGATLAMVGQHFYSHAAPSRSSPESYRSKVGDDLYDWSLRAVGPYIASDA